jgi:hypothetical protein
MLDITTLYCSVDDFFKTFHKKREKQFIGSDKKKRGPSGKLSVPEMMTIFILFHQSNYRTFKHFYKNYVHLFLRKEFPNLISYSRFVSIIKTLFIPLFAYLIHNKGENTGYSFIDSTKLQVCNNKRINRNKVFKGLAKRGKTTMGWFFGFKLHLIVNDKGEILSFLLTPGNVSDIAILNDISKGIFGKLFGDKGYICAKETEKLYKRGLHLITTIRKNMKNKLISIWDKLLLRKRSIIETINDQLKNISQVDHTRHRSPSNFVVNVLGALCGYLNQPKKPSIKWDQKESNLLALIS